MVPVRMKRFDFVGLLQRVWDSCNTSLTSRTWRGVLRRWQEVDRLGETTLAKDAFLFEDMHTSDASRS